MSSDKNADDKQQKSDPVEDNDDATENDADGNPEHDKANTAGRRFFPRVKHLLTPEWEYFLHGVLHSIQTHNAHNCIRASTSTDNPWFLTFHAVYDGVAARCCSTPHGKNRYHKFKDKMIELWKTMASTPPPDGNPNNELWKMSAVQWETFRGLLAASGGSLGVVDHNIMTPTNASKGVIAAASSKKAGGKRASRPYVAAAIAVAAKPTSLLPLKMTPGDDLPHPLQELHQIWKMAVDHGDNVELTMIRKDYHRNVRAYIAGIVENTANTSGELQHQTFFVYLKGLNALRSVKQEDDIRNLVAGTYKTTLQCYLASLTSSGAHPDGATGTSTLRVPI